jgi:two-component system LytT family response regulator
VIRTLIVDDAPLARKGIRLRLASEPDVEIVGEAGSGARAADMIQKLAPDLIYLDVQMPGGNGFELLERAAGHRPPAVIFVTAFDQYAIHAFEARAVDHLLKPINDKRFKEALGRARQLLGSESAPESAPHPTADMVPLQADHLAHASPASGGPLKRFVVKEGSRYLFVKMDDVNWIEADENYVILHTQERTYQARITMKQLEDQLDAGSFARIHRSVIVNIDRIKEVLSPPHQDRTVILKDGSILPMGRGYAERLIP